VIDAVPEDVGLIYWDYYSTDRAHYDKMLAVHKKFRNKTIFAGGAWKWIGFAPDNAYSFKISEPAISGCIKNGVRDILITAWGDNGAECSVFAVLPALVYAAELAYGNAGQRNFEGAFERIAGCKLKDFMAIDLVNKSKHILYNDPFLGIYDYLIKDGNARFAAAYKKLSKSLKKCGSFAYILENLKNLAAVLSVKAELGVKTRKAYKEGSKAALTELLSDYAKCIKLIGKFYESFRNQWFLENKPHGFDVQDIRLGGLIKRLSSCAQRLKDYIAGKTDSIPELEEEILDIGIKYDEEHYWYFIDYARLVTVNIIGGGAG
jgi:hypothetical protein